MFTLNTKEYSKFVTAEKRRQGIATILRECKKQGLEATAYNSGGHVYVVGVDLPDGNELLLTPETLGLYEKDSGDYLGSPLDHVTPIIWGSSQAERNRQLVRLALDFVELY